MLDKFKQSRNLREIESEPYQQYLDRIEEVKTNGYLDEDSRVILQQVIYAQYRTENLVREVSNVRLFIWGIFGISLLNAAMLFVVSALIIIKLI
jgi:hypothetical protein